MTVEMILTLIIILAAIGLLISNRFRPDLVALMVLLALGLSGIVSNEEIFSGFSSSAVITILGISMISIGLQQTGATNALGRMIHHIAKGKETLLIFLVSFSSALLSLFMNNIAAVGVLLPAVMSLSRRSKVSPSRLLMPLAFGTILGGMATLLTTSNIIASGALRDAGQPSFGLLDFLPVGGPAAIVGIIYLVFIGRELLPKNESREHEIQEQRFAERLSDLYQMQQNLTQFALLPRSHLAGKTIEEGGWSSLYDLNILGVSHGKAQFYSPGPNTLLHAGDRIILGCCPDDAILNDLGLQKISSDLTPSLVTNETYPMAEIVIAPHSRLIGKTIRESRFREQYSLNIIGIWRGGKPYLANLSNLVLQFGDALLVQGPALQIHNLRDNSDLILLQEDPDAVLLPRKGLTAILITIITLTIAALEILPISLVALAGAVLLILTGCMNLNDAFHGIEWKVIFLIAGLWPLSIAIQETGLAAVAVNRLLEFVGSGTPLLVISLFLFFSMLLTLMISGQVSAIVMIPLAIAAATRMDIDPRPFALAVAMGCSLAFITPLGHPVNIMVMNPGGYTFKDFTRVGFPLTIVVFFTILIAIKVYWGL
ncbi:MAG: SLC13 family permease [Anaerolineaceae bacterium]|nr:SLC13 family permease [Anaerolineaceae bacterium]